MEPVLRVENLVKRFRSKGKPDVVAVNHVSFELMPGECLGIIGESGSGKSTIANMVSGFLEPSEGEIFLDGEKIAGSKAGREEKTAELKAGQGEKIAELKAGRGEKIAEQKAVPGGRIAELKAVLRERSAGSKASSRGRELRKAWRKMQMVFQTPADSFDPRRTLGDGIGEGLRNAGMPSAQVKKEVERLLVECGLPPDFAARYPHQVSGGQCQRAAIARALAVRPKLLICDEATSALDVTIQKEILELLDDLRKNSSSQGKSSGQKLSILFICHDIALVQQFCDRVLVLYKGELVEQGSPDEIVRNPKNEYTKRLINSIL